jgi:hypothetical protein
MPVANEVGLQNLEKRVEFAVTPAMAPYLVALFCGDTALDAARFPSNAQVRTEVVWSFLKSHRDETSSA